MLFLGFLAHLEQKKFKFFHLGTHHCLPLGTNQLLLPITATNHCRHLPWWVAAVVDTGGGRHQWWLVVVGVRGWQQWWWVAIADAGISAWSDPPPTP